MTAPHDQPAGGEELRLKVREQVTIATRRLAFDDNPTWAEVHATHDKAADAIMQLIEVARTAARQQLVDEIRGKLPERKKPKVGVNFHNDGQAGILVGFNEALEAVRAILDEAGGHDEKM